MPLLPLNIPPGIVRTQSPHAARGRYIDADHVRFVNGRPEKWAGWRRFLEDKVVGSARGMVGWNNRFGTRNIGIGTHLKLYAITGGDTLTDITPIRSVGVLTDPFETEDGSAVVTVTHVGHGATDQDFVTYSGASAVGGITINGEYQITSLIDTDTYTITHGSAATSSASGGGSVGFSYQINTGNAGAVSGLGWGAGRWGVGTWGTERDTSIGGVSLDLRHWSLAEYGNSLLALASGGGLYLWLEESDDTAEPVINAPTVARAMFVTGERFVFVLGTTTPMTLQWPDRDDITDWSPSSSNTANIRTLQYGSKLMAGTAWTDLTSLVWSDTALYVFQYTGSDFVYDERRVGNNCGLIGPLAKVVVDAGAYWMSGRDFHFFSGSVSSIPNSEDVRAAVFAELDIEQATKTWCAYDHFNNQVRWGYCSFGSTNPDKYVDVNLTDYNWTMGTLPRTDGVVYRPSDGTTLMVGHDGTIYQHDVGTDADGEALDAYITFGLYALADGNQNVDLVSFVPDCERQSQDIAVELHGTERPNSTDDLDTVTLTFAPGEEQQECRLQARHFGFTVRSNVLGGDFRLGIPAVEIDSAGER